MNSKEVIHQLAQTCDDKQAKNITALDMRDVSLVADYFLICHGNNERQVQAIARSIKDVRDDMDLPLKRMEGFEQGRWILVDLDDVVCHIFHKDDRLHYNLERLWGDAERIELSVNNAGDSYDL
ncbi:ribosome silencing factor [Lentibacillus halophilus]|uniref:Ribosomal silencing factor RsfS n=1 Tax=Lentibacillus halophilus TaxID=295065 RepID=A0ABN0ZD67_9BACI